MQTLRETPKWTQPSHDSGGRVVGMNAEGTEIAVPNQRYEMMIDPDGNVVPVVVASNRELDGMDNSYGPKIREDRLNPPQRTKRGKDMTWFMYDRPPYGFSNEAWPEERAKIIQRRREESAARQRQDELDPRVQREIEKFKKEMREQLGAASPASSSESDALRSQLEQTNAILAEVQAQLADMKKKR